MSKDGMKIFSYTNFVKIFLSMGLKESMELFWIFLLVRSFIV